MKVSDFRLLGIFIFLLNPALANVLKIAQIDDFEVYQSDIRVTDRDIGLMFITEDQNELDRFKEQAENQNFINQIFAYIVDREISARNIFVSTEEIENRLERNIEIAGIDNKHASQLNEIYGKLSEALEFTIRNPNINKDKIYEDMLARSSIKQVDWALFSDQYDTLEKVERMRSLIPKNVEDIKSNSRKSTERDLIIEKLKVDVLGISNSTIHDKETAEKWGDWQRNQLVNLDVDVYEERYYNVLKTLGALNARFVDQSDSASENPASPKVIDEVESSKVVVEKSAPKEELAEHPEKQRSSQTLPWAIGILILLIVVGFTLRSRKNP
ncbi:MAG: hypothetical protein MK130_10190 [Puniceicoccaceae bacterium]|nr:hypothetical protein [Puniceicoccaceae bacterium]